MKKNFPFNIFTSKFFDLVNIIFQLLVWRCKIKPVSSPDFRVKSLLLKVFKHNFGIFCHQIFRFFELKNLIFQKKTFKKMGFSRFEIFELYFYIYSMFPLCFFQKHIHSLVGGGQHNYYQNIPKKGFRREEISGSNRAQKETDKNFSVKFQRKERRRKQRNGRWWWW